MMEHKIPILRLRNQQLVQPRFSEPEAVVAWLGAVQAQDYAGAKWSLGMRLPSSTETVVEQAVAAHRILRTWAMRGTLQFVAPQDVRWMLRLLAAGLIAGNARRYRQLELDEATLARSSAVLAEALQDGQPRSRNTLRAILEEQGVSTTGQRFAYMLQRASLDERIFQGPPERNEPVFLRFDASIPESGPFERSAALAELARRYFNSRGPAALKDFVWWSGLPGAEARTGIEKAGSDLRAETLGGKAYWGPLMQAEFQPQSTTAYLLPSYDEYLIGYADRSASIAPEHVSRIGHGNGFFSTIAIDGRIVGTWRRSLKKNRLAIETIFFDPLDAQGQAAFERAARRYAAFLGKEGMNV